MKTANNKSPEYSFWNGKNLNGTQEYWHSDKKESPSKEFKVVISNDTVSADDLW